MHTVVPPLVHVKIFTHQNLAPNHPILIETISFHENKHFFILKTSFSLFEFFIKTKGGTTCILWSPLWSMSKFSLIKTLLQNHPILIETISFHENKHFFILKTSFSLFEFLIKCKGGTTCILWSPLWSMSKFSLIKTLLQTIRF